MEKKYSFKRFLKKYFVWILISPILLMSPIVLISLLSLIAKWGSIIINANGLNIDTKSPISLGEYLYYYIAAVGIEVTGLLSYAIWKTSMESNKLWEDISNKEENKDKEIVRESALIVYYDLLSNISILKMLYSTQILEIQTVETNRLNIQPGWVKNIANLRDILSETELEMIFNLYNSFLLLSELERSSNDEGNDLKILVDKLANNIFTPVLLDDLWMNFNGVTEAILNNKYFPILRKIELTSKNLNNKKFKCYSDDGELCIKQNNGSVKYKGKFINGIMQDGTDQWHFDDGILLYSFIYKNGKIIRGKYCNRFREEYELIFDCKFNEQGSRTDGYTTTFYASNAIKYQGLIVDGQYDGQGKSYSTKNSIKPIFSGKWGKGKMINDISNQVS